MRNNFLYSCDFSECSFYHLGKCSALGENKNMTRFDPGNCHCETAYDEYGKGYDAGLADGYDNLPQSTENNNDWYDQGYQDGYKDISEE
jgi:hypothetical protein